MLKLNINRFFFIVSILLTLSLSRNSDGQKQWQVEPMGEFNGKDTPSGQLLNARAIDLDGEGNVYIVDSGRHRLIKFNASGKAIREIGGFGNRGEQFDEPRDVWARNTINIYVADYNNSRIVRFDKNLNYLNELNSIFEAPFNFEKVLSLAVSSQNDLFLLDDINRRIFKFNRFSEPSVTFGGMNEPYGQILEPWQLDLSANKYLLISDPGQSAIVVFDYFGNFIQQFTADGLRLPNGLFHAGDNQTYVVDSEDDEVFIFSDSFKLLGRLSLQLTINEIKDVAVAYSKISRHRILYVLASDRCIIFRLFQ